METDNAQLRMEQERLLRELRAHRSSFARALLARLPGVHVLSRRPIRLAFDPVAAPAGIVQSDIAAEARSPVAGGDGE